MLNFALEGQRVFLLLINNVFFYSSASRVGAGVWLRVGAGLP